MLRRLFPLGLVGLVVLLACTDVLGPLAERDGVRLVVQPSFGQVPAAALADDPASQVDNIHVLLLDDAGGVVLDTIVAWPETQDTLRLELDVVVTGSRSYSLTLQGRSGERVLFKAGPVSLALSAGSGSVVETSPVLQYAGPGAGVASVQITGAPDAFVAGSAVELRAAGRKSDGSDPGDLLVVWTSLDTLAATVNEDGILQVRHDASRAVSIEARAAFTTVTDTITGPVVPAGLSISPDSSTLTALDADVALSAALLGADGGPVTGLPVDWSVMDASVLDLTTETEGARVRALAPGATSVIATAGALADTAEVTVGQVVRRLEVDPDSVTLERVGATLQATAAAFDANGFAVQGATFEWVTRAEAVVSVASDGGITARDPGTAWVVASVDGVADSLFATVLNTAPQLRISAPSDGAVFEEGDVITFESAAEDLEDGDLSSSIAWASDQAGELGTGSTVSRTLEPGDHTVTAAVTDSDGASAASAVSVTVQPNTPPVVAITSPSESITTSYGAAVTFRGSATDEQDGDLSGSIAWSSSLDGALGTGASVTTTTLTIGEHTITANVSDSRGSTGSATRTVLVTNNAPAVEIQAPVAGSSYHQGAAVTFTGAASDVEDGDLSAAIVWSSSVDGELGTGSSLTTGTLSNGTHTVTSSVTDDHGATATTSIQITVVANAAPVVTITAPDGDSTVRFGAEVTLTATATDEQDGDLSGSIEWSSSLDGALGTGASITTTALSIGEHTITASVSDSNGDTGSATRTVAVTSNAPAVKIQEPADGSSRDAGAPVTLTGAASDIEDGDLSEAIHWSSSVDGALGTGAIITTSELTAGDHVITATVTDSHDLTSSAAVGLTIAPETSIPARLAFVQQPTATTPGAAMEPAVTVRVEDELGNPVSSTATVTIALGTDPTEGAATLAGTLSVATVDGVATFGDLSLDEPGSGYTLRASVADLTGAISELFDVHALPFVTVADLQLQTFSAAPLLITLSETAGAGGQEVFLTSSNPTDVPVPTSVLVTEGTSGVEITVTSGSSPASSTVTGSSEGFTDGSGVVTIVGRTMTIDLDPLVGVGRTNDAAVILTDPAPAGGVTVALSSSDPSIVSLSTSTVTIPAGESTAAFTITGQAGGSVVLTASAQAFTDATVTAGSTNTKVSIGEIPMLSPGQSAGLPISLTEPAPAGGVTIALESDNTAVATVEASIFIAGRSQVPASNPQVTGVAAGSAVINAAAVGFAPDARSATVSTFSLRISPDPVSTYAGWDQPVTLSLSSAAPTGGVTITLTSLDPNTFTVPASAFIPAGQTSVETTLSGVAVGSSTLQAESPITATVTVDVGVSATPDITLNNVAVGKDLQERTYVALQATPPTPVDLTLTVASGSSALISKSKTEAGSTSLTFTRVSGTGAQYFYVQGLQEGSSTTITAQAGGYNDNTATVTVTGSGFFMSTGSFTTTASSSNQTVRLYVGRLDASGNYYTAQELRPGVTADVGVEVVSSDPSVGTITTSPVVFTGGGLSYGDTDFDPLSAGSTVVSMTQPAGFTTPANRSTSLTATVNP